MRWEEMSWDKGEKSLDEMKCGVVRVQCEVWSSGREECSAKSEVWRVKCEAELSFKCDIWNRTLLSQNARKHGPGSRRMQVL